MTFGGYSPEQASGQSGTIVDAIGKGVEQLIALGAANVVVPGVLPVGCFPIYLTLYQTSNAGDYDQYGCLKRFNALSARLNQLLQSKVMSLQGRYPGARIMYADFYSHVYDMVRSPGSYGFSTNLRPAAAPAAASITTRTARGAGWPARRRAATRRRRSAGTASTSRRRPTRRSPTGGSAGRHVT